MVFEFLTSSVSDNLLSPTPAGDIIYNDNVADLPLKKLLKKNSSRPNSFCWNNAWFHTEVDKAGNHQFYHLLASQLS